MGKRCFNDTWLDKVDFNNHTVQLWCIKKDETATHYLCKKYINIESMGFAALKQHLEKLKHWGFSAHFSKTLTGHKTDSKADIGIEKDTEKSQKHERKAYSQSYISSSLKRAVQPPRKAYVKMPHLQVHLYSWRGSDCKAASYLKICLSVLHKVYSMLPTAISIFSNCKECGIWSKQDVLYCDISLKALFYRWQPGS